MNLLGPRRFAGILLAAVVALSVHPARADLADVRQILDGVREIVAPGCLPGPVVTLNQQAFPVVTAPSQGYRLPLIAAARYSRGRLLAVGHEGFLGKAALENPDNARFLTNAVRWLGSNRTGRRVAVIGLAEAATALEATGTPVQRMSVEDLRSHIEAPDFDIVLAEAAALDGRSGRDLGQFFQAFLRRGGGVLLTSLGWGWLQLHPGQSLAGDHGGNRCFAPLGLAWGDGGCDPTGTRGWLADEAGLTEADGVMALRALWRHAEKQAPLEGAALAQVSHTITAALGATTADDPFFLPRVRDLCRRFADRSIPDSRSPITNAAPFARLQAVLDLVTQRLQPDGKRTAHPAAASFPGAVPAGAPRVGRTIQVDLARPGWQSTGLYAAPGEAVAVEAPAAAIGAGLALRIGCHTDTLWHLPAWKRFPEIAWQRRLGTPFRKVASPFGGLVYIEVPDDAGTGAVELRLSGVVEAPRYIRGETSLHEWKTTLRAAPGPWAEIQGKRCIITVPSDVVRDLEDPEAVAAYWDDVMDHVADLYTTPRERRRPERYVVDRQISAGYMHSGYPIMTGDDVAAGFVDLTVLRGGDANKCWGFYHEVGHNHQDPAWTFEGTGEVTNNLASLYCAEKINRVFAGAHPAMRPDEIRARLEKYLAAGAPFETWKSDPFLALTLYWQLKEGFGWDAFQRVFASYRQAKPEEKPASDEAKRDQWMVRFSRAVGRNLGPFFVAWGVPTSEAARKSIADLPAWMPKDFPKR